MLKLDFLEYEASNENKLFRTFLVYFSRWNRLVLAGTYLSLTLCTARTVDQRRIRRNWRVADRYRAIGTACPSERIYRFMEHESRNSGYIPAVIQLPCIVPTGLPSKVINRGDKFAISHEYLRPADFSSEYFHARGRSRRCNTRSIEISRRF